MKLTAETKSVGFYVFAALVGYVAYLMLKPYLSMAVLAFVTVSLFYGYYEWVLKLVKSTGWATVIAVISVMLMFLAPLVLLINAVVLQILQISGDVSAFVAGGGVDVQALIDEVNKLLDTVPYANWRISAHEVISTLQESTRAVANFVLSNAVWLGSSSLELFSKLVIFGLFLYLFFPILPRMKQMWFDLSPLDRDASEKMYSRVLAMMQSLLKGTLVVTLIQGLVAAMLLWVTGVPYVVFWMMLMFATGLVPVGTGVVSVPIGIAQLLSGHVWQGLVVIIGSIVLVGSIDNVLRPMLVSKKAELKPGWVLLGILGGLRLFGFLGFVFGPVVLVAVKTLIEVILEDRHRA